MAKMDQLIVWFVGFSCVLRGTCASSQTFAAEIEVGDIRVQALSSTLLRVEPRGPKGFEDKTTFMVTNRDFHGIPIAKKNETDFLVTLSTEFYDVVLEKQNWPAATCSASVEGHDYSAATRSSKYPDGVSASDIQSCCNACDDDGTCIGWVYDPQGKYCWPVSDFSGLTAVTGGAYRQIGCPSRGCPPPVSRFNIEHGADADGAVRSNRFPQGAVAKSLDECSIFCGIDPSCATFVRVQDSALGDVAGANCWLLSSFTKTVQASNREIGFRFTGPLFTVKSPDGKVLYDAESETHQTKSNLLHWPSPLTRESYPITDYPRFFVPAWGTVPIPDGEKVDPELVGTNGYDFRNNVAGDTYVFLLGSDLKGYESSRAEFIKLAGECPLLPDFAFGTWYTAWKQYTFVSATAEINIWAELDLPLSVWGLDMNWRLTDSHKDWFYNNPNTKLFSNFTLWFDFLKDHKLRTYFNDHPYPVQDRGAGGGQCSAEETKFRWDGLKKWMAEGLTFWWFDHNWGFSIPPPFVDNGGHTDGNWLGLDNAAWGSHVYFNAVSYFDRNVRDAVGDETYGGRPIALTKFGLPDWKPGMDPTGHAESPAQHRFPVWWTGDWVDLRASVESMVDSGVHDFKPYVHSDCGGDYKPTAGDFMRWTAHCAYGSILRYHDAGAGAHRPWDYDAHTLEVTRSYLHARSKLMPSLIAAGQRATKTGHPLVARGDLFWPEYPDSASNQQYLFLDDILVAPIWDSHQNETSRSVWIPPGDWEDAWDGSIVKGPRTVATTRPFEQIPMWLRREGGFLIVADNASQRVEDQDWSSLTLELFPAAQAHSTKRQLFERGTSARSNLAFHTDGLGRISVEIGAMEGGVAERAWTVRVHLLSGQRVVSAIVDGVSVHLEGGLRHIEASSSSRLSSAPFFPLGGAGTLTAPMAGPVAEIHVRKGSQARTIELETGDVSGYIV
eukprot:TRINITY_DN16958_c0_g1_i1.p1 TRINITY_DN16958_c0_g1~~TRINITY_DN16958_c0_g1_i1.p1  ORF type:complete len:980 (+),score=114.21 TRINITY_DN16958_c0_g1_i1:90-2942(+)